MYLAELLIPFHIWDKVFKSGPSKICGRQPLKTWRDIVCLSKAYPFKFLKGCLPQIFLPLLNTLTHIKNRRPIFYYHCFFDTNCRGKEKSRDLKVSRTLNKICVIWFPKELNFTRFAKIISRENLILLKFATFNFFVYGCSKIFWLKKRNFTLPAFTQEYFGENMQQ